MAPVSTSKHELNNYIKCFLQSVHLFEHHSHVFASSNNYIWYKRSNFLSLLNLPDQIELFRILRWYWEWSRERFIQFVKLFMTNMRSTSSCLKIRLNHVQQSNLLQNMFETLSIYFSYKNSYKQYNNMIMYDSEELTKYKIMIGK